MPNYTKADIWNVIWSRPYANYEQHHQVFWEKIRNLAEGQIVDLGCGSASCWKPTGGENVKGYDFSKEGIHEAIFNCPKGRFAVANLTKTPQESKSADTVVLCGIVNYYKNLSPLMKEAARICKAGGKIIVTINVIDDFPDRHWDEERVNKEFSPYGKVESEFIEKIGWFVIISSS